MAEKGVHPTPGPIPALRIGEGRGAGTYLITIYSHNEIEGSISSKHNLVVLVFKERALKHTNILH